MSKQLQIVRNNQLPTQEGFFGVVTPAMVYHFLRQNADLRGVSSEYAVQVELPKSVEISGRMWHPRGEGYFVQTHRDQTGQVIDGGVVIDKKASPDVYVVTAFSDLGEYTNHPFVSKGGAGERTIGNKKLGVVLEATLEDILDFGSTWTPEQKEAILKSAVNQHYKELFPIREVKALPAEQKYLPE